MTDWSTLKKLIWLRIIKGGGSIERTVKGAIVHVINALARPAISVKCEVNPIQDLHGYDSPWPAGGGKQLINPAQFDSFPVTNNGVTATDNGDGTISLSGTATANAYISVISYRTLSEYGFFEPDTSYTFSAYVNGNVYGIFGIYGSGTDYKDAAGAGLQMTFTAEELSTLRYRIVIYAANGTNTNGMVIKPMICLASASNPTTFAPYSNICPISGRTSATVTRRGKNLVNKADGNQASNNWFIGSNRVNAGADGSFMLNAGTYTFSVSDTPSGMYVSNSSNVNIKTAYDVPQITFSISERMPIKLNIYKSGSTSEYWNALNIQLELGSTASAYEPYQGNTYTIQLGDTVYGGTLDVTGGKMVVDRRMLDMSAVTYAVQTYSGYNAARFGHGSTDINKTRLSILSNTLTAVANNVTLANRPMWAYTYTSGNYYPAEVKVPSEYDTSAKLRAFFADIDGNGTKAVILLQMATPIEITLTPTQIDMLLGTNNLWADAGDSTLTYYADGNASTSEALGILLGGTYNNPGGADDVSDDEALGILLGGS